LAGWAQHKVQEQMLVTVFNAKRKKKKNEEINHSRSNNDNILASAQPDVIRPHWTRLANNNFKKV
jgi:hypothetical protein